ncbi:glycosyltransferase, partial [Helicobacter pylori]
MCKFLDGAKSEVLKYDVISFDIFDTLLLRPFIKPT